MNKWAVVSSLTITLDNKYSLLHGIYKPSEMKHLIKKRVHKHEFLYVIFHLRFINPIFYIERLNKLYITCILLELIAYFKRQL